MAFECKHLANGYCWLLEKNCEPLQKGCVLHRTGAYFIGPEHEKEEKKVIPARKKPQK